MTNGFGPWPRWLTALLLAMLSFSAAALNCATPGKDGAGGTLSGAVNRYWPATANASTGATSIALGTSIGAGAGIAIGDLLLVIQMQDAAINSNQSGSYGDGAGGSPGSGSTVLNSGGLYEFVRATSAAATGSGTVTIVGGSGGGLLNAYTNANAGGAQGQRRFQVVRAPQYTTATLNTGLTAAAWNGSAGGVLVFDVAGQLALGGATVSVDGLGFRGGAARQLAGGSGSSADYRTNATNNNNGSKGEGIAGTPRYVNDAGVLLNTGVEGYPNGSHARGAPGNAGGGGTDSDPASNDENTGGGGGSNAGSGGKGGNGWDGGSSPLTTGGWGGFDYSASLVPGRLFLGGGGGSGTTNNGTGSPGAGFASSGAAGGGLVMIRAGSITGIGTISANGSNANNSVTNDGSGGGGAGGSVLVYSNAVGGSVGALSVRASGGSGGTNTGGGSPHGPGGGGSGGFVVTSGAASITVSGGAAGATVGGINYGATAGTNGTSATLSSGNVPGVKSGAECAIGITKSFSPDTTNAGGISTLSVTLTSSNNVVITGIVLSDVFPTTPGAMLVATPLASTNTCGGTLQDSGGATLAAADVGVRLNAGLLAGNSSCTFSLNVTAAVVGTYTNTIAAGALTSTNGGTNGDPASDTLTVTASPSLVFMKTAQILSDPVNGSISTNFPKNIPGAEVLYTLRVTNTGSGVVDSNTTVITDPIPPNTDMFVGDLNGAGTGPILFLDGLATGDPSTNQSSNLSWTYSGLANAADDVGFYNDSGCTTLITPTAPYDTNVKCIRLNPKGTMAGSGGGNPYFELKFRVRLR